MIGVLGLFPYNKQRKPYQSNRKGLRSIPYSILPYPVPFQTEATNDRNSLKTLNNDFKQGLSIYLNTLILENSIKQQPYLNKAATPNKKQRPFKKTTVGVLILGLNLLNPNTVNLSMGPAGIPTYYVPVSNYVAKINLSMWRRIFG